MDFSDQMSSYYNCLRKTLKWYRKIIYELVTGTAMVNAWVIHNHGKQTSTQMLKFREEVIRGLLDEEIIEDSETENSSRRSRHIFSKKMGPAHKTRKRCTLCYQYWVKKIGTTSKKAALSATRVNTYCEGCPNQPHMCLDCFNQKHKYL